MNKQITEKEIRIRYNAYINEGTYEKAGEKLNLSASAIKSAVRRYKNLCVCGRPIDKSQSDIRCSFCIEKNKERLKKRRKEQGIKGICIHCGKKPIAYGGRSYCEDCNDNRKDQHKKRKRTKLEKGLCLNCQNQAEPDRNYCKYHIEYHKAANKKYKLENGHGGNRLTVLERDDYTCQCCGFVGTTDKVKGKKWLEIHHLYTRENKPSNLITLCNKCHRGITHLYKSGNITKILEFVKAYYPNNF